MTALHALLAGLVDYAGLFPPAALTMSDAVRLYGAHRRSRSGWALGRFVVPAARLAEFGEAAGAALPVGPGAIPWRLSALLGPDPGSDVGEVQAFNAGHRGAEQGRATVDAVEVRVSDGGTVERTAPLCAGFSVAYEVSPRLPSLDGTLRAVKAARGVAKLRTGGVTPDAVPGIGEVASFLWACARHNLPFKLTAGLHHAVRGEYSLTYDPDSPRGVMHGLVNVLAAALAAKRLARPGEAAAGPGAGGEVPEVVERILAEEDPGAFAVGADRLAWRGVVFSAGEVESGRATFALSVGSCSFEEPLSDVLSMGAA